MQHLYKKRKGFTLTELAIVIAVIAILIAVLVPTFVSLINSANNSSDEQTVKNMNTSLQLYEAENDQPEALCVVWDILEEDGYSAQPTPNYSDNEFYWYKTDNRILIYSKSEEQFTFPAEYEGVTISTVESSVTHKTAATTVNGTIYQGNVIALNTAETDSAAHDANAETTGKCSCCGDTIAVIVDSTNIAERLTTVEDLGSIQLTSDINLTEMSVNFKTVSIDLNGYTLTTSGLNIVYETEEGEERPEKDVEVVIENGTIVQSGDVDEDYGLLFISYGAVTLKNVEIVADAGTYAINNANGEYATDNGLTISDCNITGMIWLDSDSETVINGGTFTSNSGDEYIIYNNGTLTVNSGTFYVCDLPDETGSISYSLKIGEGTDTTVSATAYTTTYQFAIVHVANTCKISNSVKFIYNGTVTKELSAVEDYIKVLYVRKTNNITIFDSTETTVYTIQAASSNKYY